MNLMRHSSKVTPSNHHYKIDNCFNSNLHASSDNDIKKKWGGGGRETDYKPHKKQLNFGFDLHLHMTKKLQTGFYRNHITLKIRGYIPDNYTQTE